MPRVIAALCSVVTRLDYWAHRLSEWQERRALRSGTIEFSLRERLERLQRRAAQR